MKRLRSICPVCGGELLITQFKCSNCGTTISGDFQANEFSKLREDQLNFLRAFLKYRGNLSEVQKEFGISYPTAKARLEEIIRDLGYESSSKDEYIRKRTMEILEMLEKGKISSEEARKLLKEIKGE